MQRAECTIHSAQPVPERQEQQTHKRPRRPRLVIAMRSLLYFKLRSSGCSMKLGEYILDLT